MDKPESEVQKHSRTRRSQCRRCESIVSRVNERLKEYKWLCDEVWKTQSYAVPDVKEVKREVLDRWMQIPGIVACGIKVPGLVFLTYIISKTDVPNLRQNMGLLETDIVYFEAVESFNRQLVDLCKICSIFFLLEQSKERPIFPYKISFLFFFLSRWGRITYFLPSMVF
jgi:hypothetical protein